MKFPKGYYLLLIAVAVISGLLVLWANDFILEKEHQNRQAKLELANKQAAVEFEGALNTYITLISGIKAYVETGEQLPAQKELQSFFKKQFTATSYGEGITISYLDTTHVFKYSFNKDTINPSGLIGMSMRDLVPEFGIQNLEKMMSREGFYAFAPYNLFEGKVGLPLGFRVTDTTGQRLGYFSVVADFKPILDRVYALVDNKTFAYKFKSGTSVFDRERVYGRNNSKNAKEDPEYYGNFDIAEENFIQTSFTFFNKTYEVSTAYKKQDTPNYASTILLTTWCLFLLFIIASMIFKLYQSEHQNRVIEKQKEQLTELVATKNKFFSIIAHDLRSPLSSVLNFLDILQEERFQNEYTSKIIQALEKSSQNSIGLLDNLLKWSKVQTGKISFNPKKTDLRKVVQDQVDLQDQLVDAKNLEIRIESSLNEKVSIDMNMIGTVIRNVVSNAIKFSHPGGIILVALSKSGSNAVITIEDGGIGIPEELRNALFDISVKTTQEGTANEKGSGLGLILAKQFVEMHDGTLEVESGVGKGTSVTITLPLHS